MSSRRVILVVNLKRFSSRGIIPMIRIPVITPAASEKTTCRRRVLRGALLKELTTNEARATQLPLIAPARTILERKRIFLQK